MSGWENFFVGELGASAALTGLIFVAVSVNLTLIMSRPYITVWAVEAMVLLTVVLLISSLLLIPRQTFLAIGIEALLIGLLDWTTLLLLQLNTLRQASPARRPGLAIILTIPQITAICFVIAGIVLLIFGPTGLYWIVAATLLSFLGALFGAWFLLIEIHHL